MSDHDVETELDRDLGLVGAVALGVGTMIAAGIFVLSGLAVANVGTMAIVAFLLAAVVASFTAFAYAEFAAIYPESGGGYAYVANTFDSDLSYIVGWSMILGYPASAAFYLASFSDWFYRFIAPLFDIQAAIPFWIPGLVILAMLVALNLKGTEESGTFQVVVTIAKVLLIFLFLFGGLQSFDAASVTTSFFDNLDKFREVGVTTALVFITFFGFEAIATNAEEIKSPGRTVPRAIFISMGFVTFVYALVVLVVVVAVNDANFLNFLTENANLGGLTPTEFVENNGEVAMGRAAQYYLGGFGFYVIIVGALFSMLSAANATILAGSRVKLAMSRRDHLPGRFEDLHDSFNTPYNAVLLTGGFILLFILLFTVVFSGGGGGGHGAEPTVALPMSLPLLGSSLHLGVSAIAHFADFMLLTGLVAVNVAVIRSRTKFSDIDRSFEVPGVPYVPIVAVLANLVLLVNVEPSSFLLGLAAEGVGVALWFGVMSTRQEAAIEQEAPQVVADHHPAEHDYEILVPVSNPDHVEQMMQTARDIAADQGGAVHVLSVMQVPEQTPLTQADHMRAERDRHRELLDRAMDVTAGGGDADVPVSGTGRIAHHVDKAILHEITDSNSDAVLLGWQEKRSQRADIVLGGTVDTVVQEADCDVLVERVGEPKETESILVPMAGGPHAKFATEVARAIAHTTGARVELATVVDPDADEAERQAAHDLIDETVADMSDVETVETRFIEAENVVDGIVAESEAFDLTVIGATREGLLQQLVFGTIPEAVGKRAESTVIMTKRNLGVRSRLRRTLKRRG